MRVSAIAAIDGSGGIGIGGRLPWHLPRDLKRFRKYTLDKPVIMGRKTFVSLPGSLDRRHQIVLTHTPDVVAQGCQVVHTIEEAFSAATDYLNAAGGDETMIIGGSRVFRETLGFWDRLYLTRVDGHFVTDAFIPLMAFRQIRWRLLDQESCPADAKNPYPHRFIALERLRETGAETEVFDLSSWLDCAGSGL